MCACVWWWGCYCVFCANATNMTDSWLISERVEVCVFVHVCVCARSGVIFRYCRKHPTDDCHSNRSGGRRKLWCDWVIFSWTPCSLKHESYSKLYKNVISLEKKKPQVASVRDQCCCKEQLFPHLPRLQMKPPVCVWGEDAGLMWHCTVKE